MKAIDRLKKSIRGVDKDKPVTQLMLSEMLRSLWSDQGKIIQIIYNEIVNNTTNIYQSISQVIGTKQADNHYVAQIENTVNTSETVVSPWSILPYNQQMGEFKAVVAVHNKATHTIETLISLFSFDYSDATPAVIQNDLLTNATMTLTVGIDGSNMLYATVSGMAADAKRIHFCYERCVLSERAMLMEAEGTFELNGIAQLTKYLLAQANGTLELNASAILDVNAEWELLLEFQTNSPNSTTFDPSITSTSGEYKWSVGELEFSGKSISVTLDGTVKNVKLYGKGTCEINQIDFSNDNILGELIFDNKAFTYLNGINLNSNLGLSLVNFNIQQVGILQYLYMSNIGISGELDLSMFSKLSEAGTTIVLILGVNSNVTSIIFANNISEGNLAYLNIDRLKASGTINLSQFTNWTNNSSLYITEAVNISEIILPNIPSGTPKFLGFNKCTNLNELPLPIYPNIQSLDYSAYSCNLSAAKINKFLCELENITIGGISSRYIYLDQINAAPDSSSGGYDGLAAKAALQAKGFNVFTN